MLTETQIQRFSRQILLRDIGGIGQERLLQSPVHVAGHGAAFEVARSALTAGGSPVDAKARWVIGPPGFEADVVIDATVVWAGCRACVRQAQAEHAAGHPHRVEGAPVAVMLGSLAALALQRLVLGLDAGVSEVRWSDGRLVSRRLKCPHLR